MGGTCANSPWQVGRITALVALVVAMFAAKPLLGGLDQAFQYIQEYSGYIYPGVVVVFGMALFWKRATNSAALWTAIATIPAGIAIKYMFPDMGFQLRMGYVFILLVMIALTISLVDEKHLVESKPESEAHKKGLMSGSKWMFALAGLCLVLGILFSAKYSSLAFEAIFMLSVLFAFMGVILYTNATSRFKDPKAYAYEPELFRMNGGLVIGSLGIVAILIGLYAYFW